MYTLAMIPSVTEPSPELQKWGALLWALHHCELNKSLFFTYLSALSILLQYWEMDNDMEAKRTGCSDWTWGSRFVCLFVFSQQHPLKS